jgi:hypothetical protein
MINPYPKCLIHPKQCNHPTPLTHVKKDHLTTFTKHIPVYDPSLGVKFLHHIQIHYDMNSNSEMVIEKLPMFTSIMVSNEEKASWFIQWNESCFEGDQKFPKTRFF